MPFTIVRQDITKMKVDAIVNAANTDLQMGGGVCGAIFRAAGAEKLQKACDSLAPIRTGEAVITPGFALPARYVIHAVGPVYSQGRREQCAALLRSAYIRSLETAAENQCGSIAFPLISSGIYGYPKKEAMQVAMDAITDFLAEHDIDVYLAVFDKTAYTVSEELMGEVESYIDEHYADTHQADRRCMLAAERKAIEAAKKPRMSGFRLGNYLGKPCYEADKELSAQEPETAAMQELKESSEQEPEMAAMQELKESSEQEPEMAAMQELKELSEQEPEAAAMQELKESSEQEPKMAAMHKLKESSAQKQKSLEEMIFHLDESFSDMLFHLIDSKGRTDAEVYKKANIDRKLFSKIRSVKGYTPKKPTILALAVALELTLAETVELLARAGYAFSHASKFDVIVEYFIGNGRYDIYEIDQVLFYYDQPLLGGGQGA